MKIKNKTLAPSALCLLYILSSPVSGGEFKCFVKAEDDNQYLVLSDARNLEVAMQMTKRWVITKKDKKKVAVKELLECIPQSDTFSIKKAVGMDNQLGR